jgi:hypothetical protein
MNWLVTISGVLAAITAAIHIVAGGKEIVRPFLVSNLDEAVKLTMYGCWHLVSVALVLSSLALLGNGSGMIVSSPMVAFISALWLLFGVVFLVVSLRLARPPGLFRFPQWALLIPVGILGLWGIA